ncbi:phospholipase D-like domain-containing protein [Candidatus Absconditicoccus praedator]|uniref:phospholipase D-like domain-containing protein n=1 Tax=Candidatus Absconditicoccus praedator TaxID=2735562 RepID=UPI001E3E5A68|nr:phospholipase D-like domain-containing protein [Candidatus Absconditicoccus praedator]UFX82710.1 hypothetical protein HLG78_00975 [Candidatus Absconditicoccus praedator]
MKDRYLYLLLGLVFGVLIILVLGKLDKGGISLEYGENYQIGYQNIQGDLKIGPFGDIGWYEDILKSSEEKIDIFMYGFSFDRIKDFLEKLGYFGSNIRILIESNKFRHSDEDYENLLKRFEDNESVQVENADGLGLNFQHAKTLLLDDKFIIQTANFTYSGFFRSKELFFISEDENIRESLEYIFEKDWNEEHINEEKIHPNLLVCNINCREGFEDLINGTEEELLVYSQNFSDHSLINKVNNLKNTDVKVLLADNDTNYNTKEKIDNGKVRFQSEPYLHAKSFLVDNKYLVVGSSNFTQNSIDNNREINIIIKDEQIIEKYKNVFENSW